MTTAANATRTNRRTVVVALLAGFLLATLLFCVVGYSINGGQQAEPAPVAVTAAGPVIPAWVDADPGNILGNGSAGPSTEWSYLSGLREQAPGLWDVPGTDDATVLQLGYKGCELAAATSGSWAEGVSVLVGNGYDAADAGVWAFQSQRYLCP